MGFYFFRMKIIYAAQYINFNYLITTMTSKFLSLIALMTLIGLLAIGLPTFINSFNTNPSVTAILMTGLVLIMILAGAIMLLLFGVIGIKDNTAKSAS
jgi:hypothetical protein